VHDGVATLECRGVGVGFREVTYYGVAGDAIEIGELAGFAYQEAKVGALIRQRFRDMMADESGGACQEDLHGEVHEESF
jgi:hypothetical protein